MRIMLKTEIPGARVTGVKNGSRLTTCGFEDGRGEVRLNGATARLATRVPA